MGDFTDKPNEIDDFEYEYVKKSKGPYIKLLNKMGNILIKNRNSLQWAEKNTSKTIFIRTLPSQGRGALIMDESGLCFFREGESISLKSCPDKEENITDEFRFHLRTMLSQQDLIKCFSGTTDMEGNRIVKEINQNQVNPTQPQNLQANQQNMNPQNTNNLANLPQNNSSNTSQNYPQNTFTSQPQNRQNSPNQYQGVTQNCSDRYDPNCTYNNNQMVSNRTENYPRGRISNKRPIDNQYNQRRRSNSRIGLEPRYRSFRKEALSSSEDSNSDLISNFMNKGVDENKKRSGKKINKKKIATSESESSSTHSNNLNAHKKKLKKSEPSNEDEFMDKGYKNAVKFLANLVEEYQS